MEMLTIYQEEDGRLSLELHDSLRWKEDPNELVLDIRHASQPDP